MDAYEYSEEDFQNNITAFDPSVIRTTGISQVFKTSLSRQTQSRGNDPKVAICPYR